MTGMSSWDVWINPVELKMISTGEGFEDCIIKLDILSIGNR